ncbi:MAG: hypothetical protein ACRBBN_12485 [Methyloligellaceae bacterium]
MNKPKEENDNFEEQKIVYRREFEKVGGFATRMIDHMTMWGDILDFLIDEGITVKPNLEKYVTDADTYMLALLLIEEHCISEVPFTLGKLARIMDRKRQASMEVKIKNLLERTKDTGLFNFGKVHESSGLMRYEISPSARLIKYFTIKLESYKV